MNMIAKRQKYGSSYDWLQLDVNGHNELHCCGFESSIKCRSDVECECSEGCEKKIGCEAISNLGKLGCECEASKV